MYVCVCISVLKGVFQARLKVRINARGSKKSLKALKKWATHQKRTLSSARLLKGAKAYAFFASQEEAYVSREGDRA